MQQFTSDGNSLETAIQTAMHPSNGGGADTFSIDTLLGDALSYLTGCDAREQQTQVSDLCPSQPQLATSERSHAVIRVLLQQRRSADFCSSSVNPNWYVAFGSFVHR